MKEKVGGLKRFEEGLNTKVKLDIYKRFGKSVEFKKYLHGVCDAGSRLLFKFRSGTHGLNEELGRHRGREGKTECSLCGDECENVSHVLWECSAYTVKPPKRGHFGVGPFVLCREVVLSQRFVFKCYRKIYFNRKQGYISLYHKYTHILKQ